MHQSDRLDPLLTLEASLVALHTVSIWAERSTVQRAMRAVGREQLEE